MNLVVLVVIVAMQVVLFQFCAIIFTRSLFAMHFGGTTTTPADEAQRHVRRSARTQLVLGGLFAFGLLSVAVGVPADWAARRLIVAGISIASSAAFTLTLRRNRSTLRRLQRALPDVGVRRAALGTRGAAPSRTLEWLVLVAFFVTGAFVFLGVRHLYVAHESGASAAATRMVVFLCVQGVASALLAYLAARLRDARTAVSPRFPMFRDRPEVALRLGIDVADAEVGAFNLAILGIIALFVCVQLNLFLRATASAWTRTASLAQWACVGFLLLVYGVYLLRVARLVRAQQHPGVKKRQRADDQPAA